MQKYYHEPLPTAVIPLASIYNSEQNHNYENLQSGHTIVVPNLKKKKKIKIFI